MRRFYGSIVASIADAVALPAPSHCRRRRIAGLSKRCTRRFRPDDSPSDAERTGQGRPEGLNRASVLAVPSWAGGRAGGWRPGTAAARRRPACLQPVRLACVQHAARHACMHPPQMRRKQATAMRRVRGAGRHGSGSIACFACSGRGSAMPERPRRSGAGAGYPVCTHGT
jgi:hypothetical protein